MECGEGGKWKEGKKGKEEVEKKVRNLERVWKRKERMREKRTWWLRVLKRRRGCGEGNKENFYANRSRGKAEQY